MRMVAPEPDSNCDFWFSRAKWAAHISRFLLSLEVEECERTDSSDKWMAFGVTTEAA